MVVTTHERDRQEILEVARDDQPHRERGEAKRANGFDCAGREAAAERRLRVSAPAARVLTAEAASITGVPSKSSIAPSRQTPMM